MLEALYEQGITPDFLVGTSVGALNAAFVASRPQSPQTATELGRVWRDLQRQDVFPLSMSALVGGVCGRRDHLVPDRELRRLIRRYIQFEDLADAAIPLHLVAFDLIEGASCSSPKVRRWRPSLRLRRFRGSSPRSRSVSSG
jgi:NTE family protein